MIRVGGPSLYRLRAESRVGGEVYERRVLERLPALGVEPVLGLPADPEGEPVPNGWRVERLGHDPSLHWTLAPRVFTPYVRRLAREGAVEVLRAPSVRHTGPSALLGRRLAGRPHLPVVVHQHHLEPRWAALEAAIMRRADAVITVSEHSRQDLLDHGVPGQLIHVVPDGIDRPPPTEGWPQAWPQPDGLRLLALGRLEPRKRHWLALDALASLRLATGPAASLVVAGDGPERARLQERARRLGVAECVRFLGDVGAADKWRLYDSSDVLLFGSGREGFGLVVAEAQSRGVPVIVAAGTASVEALAPGESGLVAAPTASAFTDALAALAADPERRRTMGERASSFAARFTWERCAAGVAEVYRSLATA